MKVKFSYPLPQGMLFLKEYVGKMKTGIKVIKINCLKF